MGSARRSYFADIRKAKFAHWSYYLSTLSRPPFGRPKSSPAGGNNPSSSPSQTRIPQKASTQPFWTTFSWLPLPPLKLTLTSPYLKTTSPSVRRKAPARCLSPQAPLTPAPPPYPTMSGRGFTNPAQPYSPTSSSPCSSSVITPPQ